MESKMFVLKAFERLAKENIRYGILRKAEEIEHGTAHDIDVAVDFARVKETQNAIDSVAKELGWERILCADKDCGNLKTIHYVCFSGEKLEIVHFDLFKHFSWNGVILIDNLRLLENVYVKNILSCVSYDVEMAIKLMSRLIYHGNVKEEYREEICCYSKQNAKAYLAILETCMSVELAQKLVTLCEEADWETIASMKHKLRESCSVKCSKISKSAEIMFKLKRFAKPQGVMVAFLGTDGSGKSTIIKGLPECIGNTFDQSQIQYYHWRPGFIKSPKGEKSGSKNNTNDPHKQKPYGKLISMIKFLYFNLDYIIGYWFSVRNHLIKNELVVFDRYYYDYYLDKYRYRFDIPDGVLFLFGKTIPKPDCSFLLIGDAQTLYERKKELPVEELEKQMRRLENMKNRIPNSRIVDVNQSIEAVIDFVGKEITSFMAGRTR